MSSLAPKMRFDLQRRILTSRSCTTRYCTLLAGSAKSSFRGFSSALPQDTDQISAISNHDKILGKHGGKIGDLSESLKDIKEPKEGSDYLDETSSYEAQISSSAPWRSEFAADRYRSYKVYMIWEALYHRSPVFRKAMKGEERREGRLERNRTESCNSQAYQSCKTRQIIDEFASSKIESDRYKHIDEGMRLE
ncbi:hypothetical protein TWF718_009877 [Orbilia javanica]|uniref:Uncharacterized protein n=1 Tax=Orbilia javanica TaxID=47235 RepID=A0AAN8RAU9_9PEZI